jgi:hypothetical protein
MVLLWPSQTLLLYVMSTTVTVLNITYVILSRLSYKLRLLICDVQRVLLIVTLSIGKYDAGLLKELNPVCSAVPQPTAPPHTSIIKENIENNREIANNRFNAGFIGNTKNYVLAD